MAGSRRFCVMDNTTENYIIHIIHKISPYLERWWSDLMVFNFCFYLFNCICSGYLFAFEVSKSQKFPTGILQTNDGWSLFLSPIFSMIGHTDFMSLIQAQRIKQVVVVTVLMDGDHLYIKSPGWARVSLLYANSMLNACWSDSRQGRGFPHPCDQFCPSALPFPLSC